MTDIVEELDMWASNRLVSASVRAMAYRAAEEIKRLRDIEALYDDALSAAEDRRFD